MNVTHLTAFAVILIGCAPLSGAYECAGMTLMVSGDYPLNCEAMRGNEALARSIFVSRGFGSADGFGQIYEGVPVLVTNLLWLSSGAEYLEGEYVADRGITLSYNARPLFHELMHHLDWVHVSPGSYWHLGWDASGFLAASAEFESRAQSPSFDATGPLTRPVAP